MTMIIKAPKTATSLTDRDLSWFSQRVERGQKEIFLEIVTITPDIAKHILENNPDNRTTDYRLITRLAIDIEHRNWQLNGETIIIAKTGELNDGQHRLMAVVKANMPIQSAMMFGVPRLSRYTVDVGKARTVSNFLSMEKVNNTAIAGSVANIWLSYTLGYYGKASQTYFSTKQDILQFYHQHRAKIDDAVTKYKARGLKPSSVICASYLILWEHDSVHADGFFHMLIEGANLDRDDPILWLRNRLTTTTQPSHERLELILRYWNAWKSGKKLAKHIAVQGEWPKLI